MSGIVAVNAEVVMLLFLLRIVILGLLTACLTMFIEHCMEREMIFRRWYLYLTYHWIRTWRRKDRWKGYILKPLGLCHYCYGTWIAIFTYITLVGFDIAIFLLIASNYLFIRLWEDKIFKYINNDTGSRTKIKGFSNE